MCTNHCAPAYQTQTMDGVIKGDTTLENSHVNVNSNYKGQRKRRYGEEEFGGIYPTSILTKTQRGRSLSIPALPEEPESMNDFRKLRIKDVIRNLPGMIKFLHLVFI